MAIWHSARLAPEEHSGPGWLGRGLDAPIEAARTRADGAADPFIGDGMPPASLRARRAATSALDRIDDLILPERWSRPLTAGDPATPMTGDDREAYVRRSPLDAEDASGRAAELARRRADGDARYPDTAPAIRLQTIARLLDADRGARVFYTIPPGYDTHAGPVDTHFGLLFELAGAIEAFLDDLTSAELAERVAVPGLSEFGRLVAENSSGGPVFLAGLGVRPGVQGKVPGLTDLVDGDPRTTTDFPWVHAAVLVCWPVLPSHPALGSSFEALSLFRPATS